MRILTIKVEGRIPSYKNSRDIFVNKKTGRMFPHKSNDLKLAQLRIKQAAIQAIENTPGWFGNTIKRGVKFQLIFHNYISNWQAPDIDGVESTILDSLQGLVFPDDRYCVAVKKRKIFIKDQPECTVISIVELE